MVAIDSVTLADDTGLVIVTVQLQLLPSKDDVVKLEATMRAFNAAADWLAGEAFALKSANKIALQRIALPARREPLHLEKSRCRR